MDFYVFLTILYIYIHIFYIYFIYYINDGDAINTVSGAYLYLKELAVNETPRALGARQILEGFFYFKQLNHFILLQLQSPLLK